MSLSMRICTLLFVAAISFSIFYPASPAFAEDYFYKEYEWDYGGSHWTTTTHIPKALYNDYSGVSVSERTKSGQAGYSFLVTTQDQYVRGLADSLHDAVVEKGYGAYDEVSFVLSFVQSLRYTSDSVSTGYDEYPRFPVETLVDDGGDCEDTAILFATLVLILNYDVIFVNPPNHYAVGVLGQDIYGSYYTYNSKRYYYCETTGDNFKIGDMPNEIKGTSAHLYPIDQSSQYVPGQNSPFLWLVFWLVVISAGIAVIVIGSIIYFSKKAEKTHKPEVSPSPLPHPPPPSDI